MASRRCASAAAWALLCASRGTDAADQLKSRRTTGGAREEGMARVAVVTGGTRGIGAAISSALKDAGYKVAANYAGNEEAASAFSSASGVPVFKWDVGDFDACKAGVAKVEAELGPVEVLVNNAGITRDTTLHRMTPEQWRAVMATNVDSLFNMTRAVIEGMRARKFG